MDDIHDTYMRSLDALAELADDTDYMIARFYQQIAQDIKEPHNILFDADAATYLRATQGHCSRDTHRIAWLEDEPIPF